MALFVRSICTNLVIFGGKYWIVGKPAMEASLQIAWGEAGRKLFYLLFTQGVEILFLSVCCTISAYNADNHKIIFSQIQYYLVVRLVPTVDDSNLENMAK